jgi:hypothetical protein
VISGLLVWSLPPFSAAANSTRAVDNKQWNRVYKQVATIVESPSPEYPKEQMKAVNAERNLIDFSRSGFLVYRRW